LLESLGETRTAGEACAVLAQALLERLRARPLKAPATPAVALDLVRQRTGHIRVEDVADHTGVSLRQLHRAIRAATALSLKAYARITRLNHAMALADRSSRPGWARLAAECGFCDQSHLVRECRSLAGLSPTEAHRERRSQAETSNPA
jgi:AraC-like DNA-binding protein